MNGLTQIRLFGLTSNLMPIQIWSTSNHALKPSWPCFSGWAAGSHLCTCWCTCWLGSYTPTLLICLLCSDCSKSTTARVRNRGILYQLNAALRKTYYCRHKLGWKKGKSFLKITVSLPSTTLPRFCTVFSAAVIQITFSDLLSRVKLKLGRSSIFSTTSSSSATFKRRS